MKHEEPAKHILFVCTGNIFRSVTAEYALKTLLGQVSSVQVGSAGVVAEPQAMRPYLRAALSKRGADPSGHRQRKVTRALLRQSHLTVCMGLDHQVFLRRHFRCQAPLYNEVCYGRAEPILDVDEVVPNYQQDPLATQQYTELVVERIWSSIADFWEGARQRLL